MKRNTRIVIVVLLLIFLVTLVYTTFLQPKKSPTTKPSRTAVEVSAPRSIGGLPEIPPSTTFIYQGQKIPPSTMPFFRGALPSDSQSLRVLGDSFSTALGFTVAPSSAIINKYYVYTREQPPQFFSLTKIDANVTTTYQLNTTPTLPISTRPPEEKARAFFVSLNIFPSSLVLDLQDNSTISAEGGGVPEYPPPTLTRHVFGLLLNNYHVLTPSYGQSWAFVSLDQTGTPRFASATVPYAGLTNQGDVAIISPRDAAVNLSNKRGILINASSTNGDHFGQDVQFTQGIIEDFELVYVYQDGLILPAYRLTGLGKTPSGDQQFAAIVLASDQNK